MSVSLFCFLPCDVKCVLCLWSSLWPLLYLPAEHHQDCILPDHVSALNSAHGWRQVAPPKTEKKGPAWGSVKADTAVDVAASHASPPAVSRPLDAADDAQIAGGMNASLHHGGDESLTRQNIPNRSPRDQMMVDIKSVPGNNIPAPPEEVKKKKKKKKKKEKKSSGLTAEQAAELAEMRRLNAEQ